jgi:hypothetical protein
MEIKWVWNRIQAESFLDDIHSKKYLKTLTDYDLFNLGVKEKRWYGDNPFSKQLVLTKNDLFKMGYIPDEYKGE